MKSITKLQSPPRISVAYINYFKLKLISRFMKWGPGFSLYQGKQHRSKKSWEWQNYFDIHVRGFKDVFITRFYTLYSWTSVIRPTDIQISLLSSCNLVVYVVYFSFISTKWRNYFILYPFYMNNIGYKHIEIHYNMYKPYWTCCV